jgi:hypothetical protein
MGIGDEVMGQLERFLLLVSQDDVLQAAPNSVATVSDMVWTADRLTKLGTAIYTMIQGYTDKAILLTSILLSWVTHFTLQVHLYPAMHVFTMDSARQELLAVHAHLCGGG